MATDNAATHPDSEGVRGYTIEEVKHAVLGRIKTAFAPVGNMDDPETTQKAEWVVNGMEKWGEVVPRCMKQMLPWGQRCILAPEHEGACRGKS